MEGGAFATAELVPGGSLGGRFDLYARGSAVHVSSGGSLAYPGLALDPLRLPHAVYAAAPGVPFYTPSKQVVHAWFDGQAWRSEDLGATRSPRDVEVGFDVAPDGTVLACWLADATELRVARRSPGGWSFESVPLPNPMTWTPLVAGDASGGVHVVVPSTTGYVHLARDPGGTWTSEPVPAVTGPRALLAHARGLALVGVDATSAWILERTAAGWGAVEMLGTVGTWFSVRAARSLDGERIAIAAKEGRLWIRDGAGTTARTWTGAGGSFSLGFGPTGKAWVLSGIAPWPHFAENPALLYQEP